MAVTTVQQMGPKSFRLPVLALLCAIMLCGAPAAAAGQEPTIESAWVTGVTTSNAVLHAEIDPRGLLTKYKLQIDPTGNFRFDQNDSCPLHPPEIFCAQVMVDGDPLPVGLVEPPESTLTSTTGLQKASVNLAAIGAILEPDTTYHFRAIAANAAGFTYGIDQMFTTPVDDEPPLPEAITVAPAPPIASTPVNRRMHRKRHRQPAARFHRAAVHHLHSVR